MSRSFIILQKYLQSQIYTPYRKSQLRVFLAKDLREYKAEHARVMQQLVSGRWADIIQPVQTDNLVVKKFMKFVLSLVFICIGLYIYI